MSKLDRQVVAKALERMKAEGSSWLQIADQVITLATEPEWRPVGDKTMAFFRREEKGLYTDEGTPGLFYFKATHWRYLK